MSLYLNITKDWTEINPEHSDVKAAKIIDLYTFDRIDSSEELPDEVRNCHTAVTNILDRYKDAERESMDFGSRVSSGKVGDLSINYTYKNVDIADLREKESKEIKETIYTWLAGTGLLFRGVR